MRNEGYSGAEWERDIVLVWQSRQAVSEQRKVIERASAFRAIFTRVRSVRVMHACQTPLLTLPFFPTFLRLLLWLLRSPFFSLRLASFFLSSLFTAVHVSHSSAFSRQKRQCAREKKRGEEGTIFPALYSLSFSFLFFDIPFCRCSFSGSCVCAVFKDTFPYTFTPPPLTQISLRISFHLSRTIFVFFFVSSFFFFAVSVVSRFDNWSGKDFRLFFPITHFLVIDFQGQLGLLSWKRSRAEKQSSNLIGSPTTVY